MMYEIAGLLVSFDIERAIVKQWNTLLPSFDNFRFINVTSNPVAHIQVKVLTYDIFSFIYPRLIGRLHTETSKNELYLVYSASEHVTCYIMPYCNWSHIYIKVPAMFMSHYEAIQECLAILLRASVETYMAFRKRLSLHSACIAKCSTAICFTAPSGVGKSTRAEHITKLVEGSYILNGDRPALLYDEAEGVRAFGMPWSGKESYFINKSAPVKAIIQLRRHVRPRIRKLDETAANRVLMERVSKPFWCEDAFAKVLETTANIAKSVPVYRLDCVLETETDELLLAVLGGNTDLLLPEGERDMKIKEGFTLRRIIDEWIVIPTGAQSAVQQGAVILDDVSAFIWEKLKNPITRSELIQCVLDEYDVDEETAAKDLDELIDQLKQMDVLEES